ncbi:MAG: Glucosamine-6-phosphate deaminase, alternative [Devosia sp.]|nr:Glucosamine-6-phosphate deaminase, alternative [Devosia sp.]
MSMTHMRAEISEIPVAVQRLLTESRDAIAAAGAALREADPVFIATIARGSSDHASAFVKYAIELVAGRPVASIGPSIQSIYGRELRFERAAAFAISQSGKSPDIVAMAASARRNGALAIAITNTAGSPLATGAQYAVDLKSGPEKSVAATKTFVASVVAGLAILAEWQNDTALAGAIADLPRTLEAAVRCDWTELCTALDGHDSLYVLGRGPAAAIAAEAALKFKETCSIHAEAFSSAEVMHGPIRIVDDGYPILALAARDAAEASVSETANQLAGQGARVYLTSDLATAAKKLPFAPGGHPLTDALGLVVSFYGLVEELSRHRGFDPDNPPRLRKVTETV